jgi:hypothetical protein
MTFKDAETAAAHPNMNATIVNRQFPTLSVVGAYAQAPLEEQGMDAIREVYMHLMPGHGAFIGSVAYQATRAPDLLAEQFPDLRDLPPVTPANWKAVAALVLRKFGTSMAVAGPVEILDDSPRSRTRLHRCCSGGR